VFLFETYVFEAFVSVCHCCSYEEHLPAAELVLDFDMASMPSFVGE